MAARVLVVDDDPNVLSVLRRGLTFAGFIIETAENGDDALRLAREKPIDLVVLDVMLPGINGVEVCQRLRAADAQIPILLLTARDRVPDRIAGFEAGADDYLVKPFAFEELLARIRALLRRAQLDRTKSDTLRFGDLNLNQATRDVTLAGRAIDLTVKEFDLLAFLLRHPRQAFSRDTIFERVWGSDFLGDSNVIDVTVMRLRDKLEARGEPRLIQTVRGVGYALRED